MCDGRSSRRSRCSTRTIAARRKPRWPRRFPGFPGWAEAETVLLYVSAFPEEIRTAPMLALAYEAGKRVICPGWTGVPGNCGCTA